MFISYEAKSKIKLKCEDCGEERVVQRDPAVVRKAEHPCRVCSNKRNGVAKRGVPSWNSGMRKPEHEVQKGSTYIDHHGYVQVYIGVEEAKFYGRSDKYVLEHRKVMQDILGRPLEKGEVVHHINGNKTDNRPENLHLCDSMSNHREIHNQLETFAFEMFEKGFINFNNGRYEIAPQYSDVLSGLGEFGETLSHDEQ